MADYVGLEDASGHVLLEDASGGVLLEVQPAPIVKNVIIPEPGSTAITSPSTITGTLLVGQSIAGDTWVTNPLDLAGGSGQVFVGALIAVETTGVLELPRGSAELLTTDEETLPVHVTGTLELPREAATVSTAINVYVIATGTETLGLIGDTATVKTERNVTLTSVDSPLELDRCDVRLTIEVIIRIAVDAVIPLELAGDDGVVVNPMLIPTVCDPEEFEEALSQMLDLALASCTPLDIDPLPCFIQGADWTILNTFKAGERVLRGGDTIVFLTPMSPAECRVLEPVTVGCDDR